MFSQHHRLFPLILLFVILCQKNSPADENYFENAVATSKIEDHPSSREIGYFWHISDVFFDPAYSPLGAPENDCHVRNSVNFTRNCGYFGELGQCSAFGLVETIARTINSTCWIIGGPDFAIFTGNLRCPNIEEDEPEAIYETMSAFITDIKNAGFRNFYPSYGWYDYYPHGHHPLKLTTLYDRLESLLPHKYPGSSIFADQQHRKTGYFSRVEASQNRIRFIVMNTNFYVKNHIASRLPDPAGQWKWLADQLEECRMAGQKAFIVMSVPPGVNRKRIQKGGKKYRNDLVWRNRHDRRYVRIISEFHDAIAAQFAGHRHEDTFRLVYNAKGKAVSSILLAPAINPSFGNHPAMRIYMFDKNTGEILDYVQYYFNLTKANMDADMITPEKYWEVGYSFRDSYRLPDATVSSLENLVESFGTNEAMFQRYQSNAEGPEARGSECDGRCRVYSICAIKSMDSGSFFECLTGESMENKRRIRESVEPNMKSLRDRLVLRRNNPAPQSQSLAAALNLDKRTVFFSCSVLLIFSVKINMKY